MVRSFLQDFYEQDPGDIPLEVGVKLVAKYGLQVPDFMKEARICVQEAGDKFYEYENYGENLSAFLMHKMDPKNEYSYVREDGEDTCYEDSETERKTGGSESDDGSGSEEEEDEEEEEERNEPASKKMKVGDI